MDTRRYVVIGSAAAGLVLVGALGALALTGGHAPSPVPEVVAMATAPADDVMEPQVKEPEATESKTKDAVEEPAAKDSGVKDPVVEAAEKDAVDEAVKEPVPVKEAVKEPVPVKEAVKEPVKEADKPKEPVKEADKPKEPVKEADKPKEHDKETTKPSVWWPEVHGYGSSCVTAGDGADVTWSMKLWGGDFTVVSTSGNGTGHEVVHDGKVLVHFLDAGAQPSAQYDYKTNVTGTIVIASAADPSQTKTLGVDRWVHFDTCAA